MERVYVDYWREILRMNVGMDDAWTSVSGAGGFIIVCKSSVPFSPSMLCVFGSELAMQTVMKGACGYCRLDRRRGVKASSLQCVCATLCAPTQKSS
jgi:hypothetical protein